MCEQKHAARLSASHGRNVVPTDARVAADLPQRLAAAGCNDVHVQIRLLRQHTAALLLCIIKEARHRVVAMHVHSRQLRTAGNTCTAIRCSCMLRGMRMVPHAAPARPATAHGTACAGCAQSLPGRPPTRAAAGCSFAARGLCPALAPYAHPRSAWSERCSWLRKRPESGAEQQACRISSTEPSLSASDVDYASLRDSSSRYLGRLATDERRHAYVARLRLTLRELRF